MSQLAEIVALCKCEVSVTVNEHRNYYETVEQWLAKMDSLDCTDDVSAETRAEMIARGVVVQVRAYNNTPVGCYVVYHWDLDEALRQMLAAGKGESSLKK